MGEGAKDRLMRVSGDEQDFFFAGGPFIHDPVVQCFLFRIIGGCIGIDPQEGLQRCPYIGDKEFAEPVAVGLGIALVAVGEK